MPVVSLYLSTKATGKYAPIDKSNFANVKWSIPWNEVLGDYYNSNVFCNVRCKLLTYPDVDYSSANSYGTVRANFTSSYSNITNGFVLGIPIIHNVVDINNEYYLDLDTTNTNGSTINCPNNNYLNIQFLEGDELTLMPAVNDYELILYFDFE